MSVNKTKAAKPSAKCHRRKTVNRAVDDPHRLARRWLQSLEGRGHGVRVVHHRDEYLRWDGDAYRPVPPGDLDKLLTAFAEREFTRHNKRALKKWAEVASTGSKPPVKKPVGKKLIADVKNALAAACHLPAEVSPPAWVTAAGTVDEGLTSKRDPRFQLAMPAGLLDLRRAAAGDDECERGPTPSFFTRTCVDYEYSPTAGAPNWLQFLDQIFGVTKKPKGEKALKANKAGRACIRALRQWFGYLLTADTSYQKMLMLIGPVRSGKGTILRVLSRLVGPASVASVKLEDLGQRFGLWPLRDKTVGLVPDLRLGDRADRSAVVERLLSVSGEDVQQVERKFGDPFTARLPTRFVLVTNEVPRLVDASEAMASRTVVIRTARSFLGNEDKKLEGKLLAELPGILIWALGGLADLAETGRFTQPAAGKGDLRSMRDLASPVGAFFRDRCVLDPDATTETGRLFEAYQDWCRAEGRKFPATKEQFGRDLRAAGDIPRKQRRCKLTGKREPHYHGVKLLPG